MLSVDQILDKVYGGKSEAAAALGTKKNAPWNWRKAGHFPARIAIQISLDAAGKVKLEQIPTLQSAGSK